MKNLESVKKPKQRVLAKVAIIEPYNERIKDYKQNRLGKNYLLSRMKKTKKVMKYLMQIKVVCFGVAYGVKVKNIIEMQSG